MTDEERHPEDNEEIESWKADQSILFAWLETKTLAVMKRMGDIAEHDPKSEVAEKAARTYTMMATKLIDAIHEGKMLQKKAR